MTGSSLTPRGSTRRWRRLRALRLELDGYRCRFVVDVATGRECGAYATHVHHVAGRAAAAELGAAVDSIDRLASACAMHNLTKGAEPGLVAKPPAARPRRAARHRWEW